jgi:protein tyrosine/serine phosphatase
MAWIFLVTGGLIGPGVFPQAHAGGKAPAVPGLPGPAPGWVTAPRSGPIPSPLENFGVVAPGCLYRSAQPRKSEFKWLAKNGVRSIVSLRKEYDNGAERMQAYGFQYLYLPIRDNHAPTDAQARAFLEFVRDPAHWPVLIHCEHGMGRAGTMAALARYAIDGWPMETALREARSYRLFGFRLNGEQRRWLNRWKDRFPPGEYHPARPLPSPAAGNAALPTR